MTNFKPLDQKEYDFVWNRFDDLFLFKPSINDFPAISTDKPQLKFDIKDGFSKDFPFQELERFAIILFEQISNPGDRFYALDWQHECYDFDPRVQMDKNAFDEWIIPIFPNGDYSIFLTKDFSNVWLGHPWEQTITLIGKDMVEKGAALNDYFPKIN